MTGEGAAEEIFKESEEKFHLLFERSADGNLILDNGRFIDCNDAALRIAGFTVKGQLIGLRPMDISPEYQPNGESSVAKAEQMIARAYETGFHYFEWMAKRPNGSELALEVLLTAIPMKGRRLLHVNWRDISTRKRAEEALRESEQRYRSLVENSNQGIFVVQDGVLKYANRAGLEITGYSEQQISLAPFLALIHPDDRAMAKERHLKLLRGKEVESRYMFRLINKNGNIKWVELGAAVIHYEGRPATLDIVTDTTERKQVEEALQESEKKYHLLLDTLNEGVWAIDKYDATMFVNPRMASIVGYAEDELLGRNVYDFLHSPSLEAKRQLVNGRRTPTFGQFDGEFMRKDGTRIITRLKVAPIVSEGGEYMGSIASVTDITEQRNAESEVQRLQAQLLQAQKMEAIGRLAGGVAHDFNNLLTTILGNAELIKARKLVRGIIAESAEEIQKAALRAAELTHQLLAFSRKQMLQPKVLDLNGLVKDLSKMLRRLIGEDITLEQRLGSSLGSVKADPGQIEQVILNLVLNARDAMSVGGRLVLETRNVAAGEALRLGRFEVSPGPYVSLTVRDTGIGMNETVKAHIFEPFFTTKEPGKGTGLRSTHCLRNC